MLENFDREITQLHDTLDIASALVSKGSFLVKAGKPADALPLFDEAEFLRFKFGGGARTQLTLLFGWRELADYLVIRGRSAVAARYWLAHRLDAGLLSRYAAAGLISLFKDKVAVEQLDELYEYVRRESH